LGYRAKSQYHNLRQFFSYIVDAWIEIIS
jgi:hypothetical protein